MSGNDNVQAIPPNAQPTMLDLFHILTATKNEIGDMRMSIDKLTTDTTQKIQSIETEVETIAAHTIENTDRIDTMEIAIEQMKQDQLKNNICISGVPPGMLNGDNTAEIVIQIANKLNVQITAHQFSAYPVANGKFIIARFYNIKFKQQLQNKIRARRSLMVEECFTNTCNSQIYLNDHLTPYMNRLYLAARMAKKEGKLASATSHGGKIRARKSANDPPIIITSDKQLRRLIETDEANTSTDSLQLNNDSMTFTASTSQANTQKKTNTNNARKNESNTNNKTSPVNARRPRRAAPKASTSNTQSNDRQRKRKNDGSIEGEQKKHEKKRKQTDK